MAKEQALEELRHSANRQELGSTIGRLVGGDGSVDPLPGIRVTKLSRPLEQVYGESKPAVCFIAQGAKEVYLGDSCYRYDTDHYLLATVELPVRSIVQTSADDGPYLGVAIFLDSDLVASVMVEAGLAATHTTSDSRALSVSRVDPELFDAATRLVRLLEKPQEAKVLVPQVKREIVYRLLLSEQGHRLRQLPAPAGHTQRIAQALEKLREDFDQPLRIDALAQEMGMSSTRFHHHFKAVTDMSPLQFQKQIRLQEARRLMLNEDMDAASAAYKVGYEDPSHFSRDYKRHFGEAPMRNISKLRETVAAGLA